MTQIEYMTGTPTSLIGALARRGVHAVITTRPGYPWDLPGHHRAKSAPGGAIAVVDPAGTVIYLERLDGTFANASAVSIGKARTAALFAKPTRFFEESVNKGRYAMLDVAAVAPFTPLQGGIPILVDGKVVGAIGVSGAASAAQDEEIAIAGAAAIGKE